MSILGPDKGEIEMLLKKLGNMFRIEDQGDLSDYLGIKIERLEDGTLERTQPTLIKSILNDLGLNKEESKNLPNSKTTPANSMTILTNHEEDIHDEKKFRYRQVIGKPLYLEKST
jgi:hypothetical protein